MFQHRLHTIKDVDAGRIPDNRAGAYNQGAKLPPNTSATNPWYFGGANQRLYVKDTGRIGAKGAFRNAHGK